MRPPPSPLHLHRALGALYDGGVIACPTEAVWGLSCDPFDEEAVLRLLALKRRPVDKGLILVAANMEQLAFLFPGLSKEHHQMLTQSWPGPATWLVPHDGRVPSWVTGKFDTVAVRVSAHPVVAGLCGLWRGPLVSTSANRTGARPAMHAFQVERYFGRELDFVLPGRLGSSKQPSSITDLLTGQKIRQ